MSVLLLRLAGPMQAWGSESRFVRRGTELAPTKSGVIGMLAAAQGRRRTDPIEDLCALSFGVRIDVPGQLVRDFQTAHHLDSGSAMPLSYRFYLGDAVFLAGVEGDDSLVEGLAAALLRPTFPLYLGRRSCPPAGPLRPLIRESGLLRALFDEPWQASPRVQRHTRTSTVRLEVRMDAPASGADDSSASRLSPAGTLRDVPLSFSPERREYGWRDTVSATVEVPNPVRPLEMASVEHDPLSAAREA